VDGSVLTQMTEFPAWPSRTLSARLESRFHTWTEPLADLHGGERRAIREHLKNYVIVADASRPKAPGNGVQEPN